MNINDYKGPFLGFTFCGEHSSNFKIVRINSSDKGTMPITPEFKDTTVERVNADGTFYFSTQNTSINFEINFGFDKMTEVDLQNLRSFLSSKKYGELIFDEAPYKKYIGKLKQAATLNYVAFDEDLLPGISYPHPELPDDPTAEQRAKWLKEMIATANKLYGPNASEHNERIYKGEGTIQFVCYYPYAIAPYQTLEEYEAKYVGNNGDNIEEWKDASRIMASIDYDKYNLPINNNKSTNLNNVGDLESPLSFDLVLTSGGGAENYIEINLADQGLLIKTTNFTNNTTYHFDSEKKLITNSSTGDLMNYAIVAGDFFNVPLGISTLSLSASIGCTLSNIKYEYRYL